MHIVHAVGPFVRSIWPTSHVRPGAQQDVERHARFTARGGARGDSGALLHHDGRTAIHIRLVVVLTDERTPQEVHKRLQLLEVVHTAQVVRSSKKA